MKHPVRGSAAIVAGAAMLLAIVLVTPATAAKPPKPPVAMGSITFCPSTYETTEGLNYDSSTASSPLTVTLCRDTTKGKYLQEQVMVSVDATNGTAFQNVDYAFNSTTVTFQAREKSKTIQVGIKINGVSSEPDKSFTLSLESWSSDWSVGPDATVTIHDMPLPPAPTSLQGTKVGGTQIDWTWQSGSFDYGPMTYQLLYNPWAPGTDGRDFMWTWVAATSSTSYSEDRSGAFEEPGDTWGPYYYTVRAVNAEGAWGPFSNEVYIALP